MRWLVGYLNPPPPFRFFTFSFCNPLASLTLLSVFAFLQSFLLIHSAMHVSTLMPCYNSYRIFQVIETHLTTAPAAVAPAWIRLLCPPVAGLSYPLTIKFLRAKDGQVKKGQVKKGQVKVRKYSVKQLVRASGLVWRPNTKAPGDMVIDVVGGISILQAVRLVLKLVRFFSSSSSSFKFLA